MTPIFIKGKEISFTTSICVNNESYTDLSIEDMVTEYGFFIHMSRHSYAILDLLRMPLGDVVHNPMANGHQALLITSYGQLLYLSVKRLPSRNDAYGVQKFVIPISDNIKTTFSHDSVVTDRATLALDTSDDISVVINNYMKTSSEINVKYFTLNIADVIEYLKENKPSKPLNYEHKSQLMQDCAPEY